MINDDVRLALVVAEVIDGNGHARSAGIIRRLARHAVELAAQVETLRHAPQSSACPHCGKPIEQTPKGRPRLFCSPRCRKADHRDAKRRNDSMVA